MEQIVTQLTDFNDNYYLFIFRNPAKKIQDSFNLTTITAFQYTLISYRPQFYYNENVSDKLCRENRNTYLLSTTFFEKFIFWEIT